MRVAFRGVRGSVPWDVPAASAHGCNTACIEIVGDSGRILVLDAGSGIVGVTPPPTAPSVALLLTHYHWDHVLGLPFFAPLYDPRLPLTLHAPTLPAYDPRWLEIVFHEPFYPLPYRGLPNAPEPRLVCPGPLEIDGFDVQALALQHPGGALAYRVKGAGGDFVYATDHEFGTPERDEPLGAFIAGAAAVVLDAQFTPEERPRHAGWGHSDWRQCAEFAAARGVGALYLFHHKPGRTDAELSAIEADARRVFVNTHAAREGHTFEI
jgi:phosphoribosyl 1,2-cyclic phosphodiesterase